MKDIIGKEFICTKCGQILPIKDKGNAFDSKNKPIDVCKACCIEEQKRQYYEDL